MADGGWLTLSEAGDLVHLSARTLKRRIDDGDLPGQKRPWRGKQEAWMVRQEDLAAWADSTGHTLTLPDKDTGQRGTAAESGSGTGPSQDPDNGAAGGAEADRLRQENTALRDRLTEVQRERDWLRNHADELRDHAEQLTRALPAPRQESPVDRRGLWQRIADFFGGRNRTEGTQ